MARVQPSSLITSISGSTCHHDGTYFATNKQTRKVYAAKRCFSSDKPMTEAQKEQQAKFGSKAKFASAWWSKNKPSHGRHTRLAVEFFVAIFYSASTVVLIFAPHEGQIVCILILLGNTRCCHWSSSGNSSVIFTPNASAIS